MPSQRDGITRFRLFKKTPTVHLIKRKGGPPSPKTLPADERKALFWYEWLGSSLVTFAFYGHAVFMSVVYLLVMFWLIWYHLPADALAKAAFHNPNKRTISMTDPVIFQKSPMPIEVEEGKTYFWCACGKSAKQPFCDGSHKDTGIAPVKITAEATKKMFFCGCKSSAKAPLCDGSHSKL